MIIRLTPRQARSLIRPVNGDGGFQRLLVQLQEGMRFYAQVGWSLEFTVEMGESVRRYSNPKYGPGTYQTILRGIVEDVEQAMLEEQADLPFGD